MGGGGSSGVHAMDGQSGDGAREGETLGKGGSHPESEALGTGGTHPESKTLGKGGSRSRSRSRSRRRGKSPSSLGRPTHLGSAPGGSVGYGGLSTNASDDRGTAAADIGAASLSSAARPGGDPVRTHRAHAPRPSGPVSCGECERTFRGGSTTTRCMASSTSASLGSGAICGYTVHVNCLRRHMLRWHPDCPIPNIADGPAGTMILAREPLRDPQQDAKEAAAVDAEEIRRLMAYGHALKAQLECMT